jgi:hypothetical protein
MAYSFQNLKKPQSTGSGVADEVLVAPVSWFDTIKCPAPPYTNRGDEVTIWEDHIFNYGKAFVKFYLAPEKNQLKGLSVGDKGFQKLDLQLEVFLPGSYAELHETIKNLLNTPLIVLVQDSNCILRQFYQLGCDCAFAYTTPAFGTGTTREGNKGYNVNLSYLGGYVQLYKGLIDIMADEVSSSEPEEDIDTLLIGPGDSLLIGPGEYLLI